MTRTKIIETNKQEQNRKRHAVTIRILRAIFGITQSDLAAMTGLSFSTIAKFEKGNLRISDKALTLLLSVFENKGVRFHHHGNEVSFVISPKLMTRLYGQEGLRWLE